MEHDFSRLASFHTASLRKILRIFWPRKKSNDEILRIFWPRKKSNDELLQAKQEDIRTLVTRRWRSTGHVLWKGNNKITRIAMCWIPEGKWNRGRQKQPWCRTVEKGLREFNIITAGAPLKTG